MKEIEELKKKLDEIVSTKTRTYEVSFRVSFNASRTDDISHIGSFEDHVGDAFSYFGFSSNEGITDVFVNEI